MQYVEIDNQGETKNAGYAPYLDYRPLTENEQNLTETILESLEIKENIEKKAMAYAITKLVPNHLQEIKQRKQETINKTILAVKDRLTKEINYWDHRATQLRTQEEAGKTNARLNSKKAQTRADELQARLQKRLLELEQERKLSPLPPIIVGAALIVPIGLLKQLKGEKKPETKSMFAKETKEIEKIAIAKVIETEKAQGNEPIDVSQQKCGYDIESRNPITGRLRLIEVKGRIEGAETITITKNEILTALNKPQDYILALVKIPPKKQNHKLAETKATYSEDKPKTQLRYIEKPFQTEPDFAVSSINYNWKQLWQKGE